MTARRRAGGFRDSSKKEDEIAVGALLGMPPAALQGWFIAGWDGQEPRLLASTHDVQQLAHALAYCLEQLTGYMAYGEGNPS